MKRNAEPGEVCPLRERFEMIDRLAGLDFDHALQSSSPLEREQHEVGIHDRWGVPHRRVLLDAWIDAGVELSAQFCLQQADQTVVLELLTYRPYQNGAHLKGLHTVELTQVIKPLTLTWFFDRAPYPTGYA